MIWWLENPTRARAEQSGIAELAERVDWLTNIVWHLSDGALMTVDFDIERNNKIFPLTMTYASFHPNAPPTVKPRDGRILSSHQYGIGGSLCLEFRADTWETTVNGAMMIESTHRLIVGEQDASGYELPSAHLESTGQNIRGSSFRFLITRAAEAHLISIQPGCSIEIELSEKYYGGVFATTVTKVDEVVELGAWPTGIQETIKPSIAVRLPAGMSLPEPSREGILETFGALQLVEICEQAISTGKDIDVVLIADRKIAHYHIFGQSRERHYCCSRTLILEDSASRLPDDYSELAEKRVGVVGCGSLGSKVAAMLVRSGVRRLILVDDDVFLFENVVRNDLGALAVGVHKVDALSARLTEIVGNIDITPRRVALGGQESSSSTESVMTGLGACDIIIDATANPHCFNFCAAVAKGSIKPLVWGEVFAGGIGGLVARVRSGHEPEPQTARNQIVAWCNAHNLACSMPGIAAHYSTITTEGTSLTADDAEVSIIAGHIARFAIDALLHLPDSAFPVPAYAIGLRKAWIFSQPFETWPIQLAGSDPWTTEQDSASLTDAMELLRELMPSAFNNEDQSPD